MLNKRIIARLDIKAPNLIKGINLEGLRVVGDPQKYAHKYYLEGADELLFMDIVASLYERNSLHDLVKSTAENIFIPLTVGGGIRSVEDAAMLLRSGADKIALNTAAIKNPDLISQIAKRFGSQCVVLSIEAKNYGPEKWEAYYDNGREHTHMDAVAWAQKAEDLGAGELLLTSVDREGTRKGFDVDLVRRVSDLVRIPVIASGGMGDATHLIDVVKNGHADAVAMADVLHYNRMSISEIKKSAFQCGIPVRMS